MGRLYWLLLFLFTSLATHAAYVLFAPARTFDLKINEILDDRSTNKFIVLNRSQALRLFPAAATGDVVGLCRYDVALRPVSIVGQLPHGIWTFSVFTVSGKQVYTVSDVQAGDDTFTVELSRAQSLMEQALALIDTGESEAEAIGNAGWKVQVAETKGLAIVWVPLQNPLLRQNAVDTLKLSRCTPA